MRRRLSSHLGEIHSRSGSMRQLPTLLFIAPLVLPDPPLLAWDTTSHAIVAMLAEERLTPQARTAVTLLLEGQSMPEVASWPDQVRNTQTAPWHCEVIQANLNTLVPSSLLLRSRKRNFVSSQRLFSVNGFIATFIGESVPNVRSGLRFNTSRLIAHLTWGIHRKPKRLP